MEIDIVLRFCVEDSVVVGVSNSTRNLNAEWRNGFLEESLCLSPIVWSPPLVGQLSHGSFLQKFDLLLMNKKEPKTSHHDPFIVLSVPFLN